MTDHPKLAYGRATLARSPDPDGPLEFIASTEGLNRYGFTLRNEGWRITNYQANPVFMWMHDTWSLPIGRTEARLEGRQLRAVPTFDAEDEFARKVERLYRQGFLNAVSVGWDFVRDDGSPILDWWRLSPEEIAGDDVFYDLAEISAVPVPGDPGALVAQRRLALSTVGRELAALFDPPTPPPAPPAVEPLADQVAAAVAAELARLGITTKTPAPATAAAVDPAAAQALAAAFTLGGGPHP